MKKFAIKQCSLIHSSGPCLALQGNIIPFTHIKEDMWLFDSREEAAKQLTDDDRERIVQIEVEEC